MNLHRGLGIGAAVLAVLAAFAGSPRKGANGQIDVAALARDIEHEDDHVTALELAQWIKDRKPGLRVIDVRADSAFNDFHIPTAERVPITALAAMKAVRGETIVLYSDGGAHAAQGWVLLRSLGHANVYFLRGGLLDWMDDVMSPVLVETDTSRARVSALSRYFGGAPRLQQGAVPALPAGESSPAAAVARAKRRGC